MMFGQTKLETRVYELPRIDFVSYNFFYFLNISEITGFDLDYANIKIAKVNDYYIEDIYGGIDLGSSNIMYNGSEYYEVGDIALHEGGTVQYGTASTRGVTYDGSNNIRLDFATDGWIDLVLAITAPFPQEDTGYIEDGFDYCVEPGQNLMSYPCDSDVALLDAIPSDALNEFIGIIGEGVAATNLNGNWIGSITSLSPGSGYWIQSNTALCFNYDCSEN